MFDIGFYELLLVLVVALVVLGPERLPVAVRYGVVMLCRLKQSFQSIKAEVEKELNFDEIKQDIHNDQVMRQLEKQKHDTALRKDVSSSTQSEGFTINRGSVESGKSEFNQSN